VTGQGGPQHPGLSPREITKVVNRYIGVSGGYLGDFSYRTHADFYPEYCNLDVDSYEFEGTTRERFIAILTSRAPLDQARVLRGVLQRFPAEEPGAPTTRAGLVEEMTRWIARLESGSPIVVRVPEVTRAVVVQALEHAEHLLQASGATSGVDRVHTALHGHLIALCEGAGIEVKPDESMVAILKALRRDHPMLQDLGPRRQDIEKILNSAGNMLDAFDPVRNRASYAHPNVQLLDDPEAMLVTNAARMLLNYLDAKLAAD
jgi:hypothetical protein